ncbi:hypothetical protein GCM10011391_38360 [Pullulanibacillus camelliae]|uniref:Uncharacterized protein n=1 Tax=Pullulanibacillus camelliae TaxID=1707096 RepID=A0A8J2YP60_9BACL|nr:hypothetical protein GCM10011391_38360 [Pullulanibacillus camelliae]
MLYTKDKARACFSPGFSYTIRIYNFADAHKGREYKCNFDFAIKACGHPKCVIGKNHIRSTSEGVQAKFSNITSKGHSHKSKVYRGYDTNLPHRVLK